MCYFLARKNWKKCCIETWFKEDRMLSLLLLLFSKFHSNLRNNYNLVSN